MKKMTLIQHFILSLLCGLMATAADRPNIVFIFSDDHATQAVGAYGYPITKIARTPHLDRLAASGMRFDRCLVTNSICGPSRAAILTGKYSHLNGFYYNEDTEFDGSQDTFPKRLQGGGYQTALIGKWHLGSEPTGFTHWDILPGQGDYYNPDFINATGRYPVEGYVTDVITKKAIRWLESERDVKRPFMLMVQHKAPHREWSPDLKYLDLWEEETFPEPETLFDDYANRTSAAREQDMSLALSLELDMDLKIDGAQPGRQYHRRSYSRLNSEERQIWEEKMKGRSREFHSLQPEGKDLVRWKYQQYIKDYMRCIRSVDDSVGEIQQYLSDNGLLENTVFIYSSDQGFYLGEHGWFDKRFMYDESYRTPLLVSWPGVIQPGSVNSKLVSNLDFAQTFLEIAGLQSPATMQGKSLVPLLQGETPVWRKHHYYHYYEYPGWHMVYRHEGIYDGRFKLIHYYDVDEWELIDTKKDPLELKSVYGERKYAVVEKELKAALQAKKAKYCVPPGVPEPRQVVDPMRYYSSQRREAETSR